MPGKKPVKNGSAFEQQLHRAANAVLDNPGALHERVVQLQQQGELGGRRAQPRDFFALSTGTVVRKTGTGSRESW